MVIVPRTRGNPPLMFKDIRSATASVVTNAGCHLVQGHRKSIPKTRWGDYLIHLERFLTAHDRFPKKPYSSFHDTLFHIKVSRQALDPLRVLVSDKEHVKRYVSESVGEQYNLPPIAVLRTVEEAVGYEYPERCVIKPTHMSAEIILRKGGEEIDLGKIAGWFATDYYDLTRERNYKGLTPKVIVEPFAFDQDEPDDYRVFCFRGKPKMIFFDENNLEIDNFRCVLDVDWRQLPFSLKCGQRPPPPKPECLAEMLDVAARLSRPFSFIRVDFYTDGKTFHVGELTNCHAAAMQSFVPRKSEAFANRYIFGN